MMPPGPLVVVLLLGLLFVAGIHGRLHHEEEEEVQGGGFSLPVLAPHVPESGEERREHFRALKAKDLMRQRRMMRQVSDLMSKTDMFELPMRSALNIAQVGMYIVVVRIGTPALPYSLALETANAVTWINCRLRRRRGKHPGRPHVPPAATTMSVDGDGGGGGKVKVIKNWYRPAKSSSWRRFRCSQSACMDLPYNTCQSPNQNTSCTYYQVMEDETITSGIYGQEKATVAVSDGTMKKLPGLVIGCSTFEHGGAVDSHDGILSLGNSPASFGIAAARRFGGRLSFCLLATSSGRNASSYLTFGANPAVQGPGKVEELASPICSPPNTKTRRAAGSAWHRTAPPRRRRGKGRGVERRGRQGRIRRRVASIRSRAASSATSPRWWPVEEKRRGRRWSLRARFTAA